MITPSGLYTDKGSVDLRSLFLNQGRWRWLFVFENRDKLFDIDSRFKFCPVIVEKGGETDAIETAFMRRNVADWAVAERIAIPYRREQVERFSPSTRAILEIRSRRDLEIMEKIYATSVLLGDQGPEGWGIKYATEFHMTNDSRLFHPRPALETDGYRADEYGRWLLGRWRLRERGSPGDPSQRRQDMEPGVILSRDGSQWIEEAEIEDVALPLYEGRMIGQFDFSQKGWVSGRGRGASWADIEWPFKSVAPQFLIRTENYSHSEKVRHGPKIAYMRVGSATNARTVTATYARTWPAGDSVFYFVPHLDPVPDALEIVGFFNSLTFDWQVRQRVGGLNLSEFIMLDCALPRRRSSLALQGLLVAAMRLSLSHQLFAPEWLRLGASGMGAPLPRLWALRPAERTRVLVMLEAIVATMYGLERDDVAWVVRSCDLPEARIGPLMRSGELDMKGFWRVDKEKDPELRHPVLALVAFEDLQTMIAARGGDREKGIAAFCAQNDGDGWMLPETLRLSDYGLGHDDRARHHQPVREALGPRFFDFQLEQSVEDSWKECRIHARNLLGEVGYAALERELSGERVVAEPIRRVAEPAVPPYETRSARPQEDLFGRDE